MIIDSPAVKPADAGSVQVLDAEASSVEALTPTANVALASPIPFIEASPEPIEFD